MKENKFKNVYIVYFIIVYSDCLEMILFFGIYYKRLFDIEKGNIY